MSDEIKVEIELEWIGLYRDFIFAENPFDAEMVEAINISDNRILYQEDDGPFTLGNKLCGWVNKQAAKEAIDAFLDQPKFGVGVYCMESGLKAFVDSLAGRGTWCLLGRRFGVDGVEHQDRWDKNGKNWISNRSLVGPWEGKE